MTYDDVTAAGRTPASSAQGRDWLFEARSALDAADYQHASYAAREALAVNGNSAEAWSIRSEASFGLDHYQDAAFEAREATRLAPNVAQHHLDLAQALEVLKQYDEALREFQEAVRLDPRDLKAQAGVGSVYLGAGRPEEAVRVFDRLHKEAPNEEMFGLFLAQALIDEAEAKMTSLPDGRYAVTSPEQARLAVDHASRGLALKFRDEDGLRESLEQLQRLGTHAMRTSWRLSQHALWYLGVAIVALILGISALGSLQTLIFCPIGLALCAGVVWLYVKRHRKPNWMWAGQDVGRP